MERPTCAICPYWHRRAANLVYGECHRHTPPWRPATAEDWCGEHPDFPAHLKALYASRSETMPFLGNEIRPNSTGSR